MYPAWFSGACADLLGLGWDALEYLAQAAVTTSLERADEFPLWVLMGAFRGCAPVHLRDTSAGEKVNNKP